MKTIFLTLTAICFFTFSKLNAQTVYVTTSGKKFHAKNCEIVKSGKKGIELTEAKKQGYEPCKACKVEATNPKEQAKDKPKQEKEAPKQTKDKPKTKKQ